MCLISIAEGFSLKDTVAKYKDWLAEFLFKLSLVVEFTIVGYICRRVYLNKDQSSQKAYRE